MKKRIVLILPGLFLLMVISIFAGRFKSQKDIFPADDIELLVIKMELSTADIRIGTEDMDDIALADIEYYPKRAEVYTEYEKDGSTGYLEFGSKCLNKFNIDTEDNTWDIILSQKYDTELMIELGACEAEIDLGGIPLERVDLDIGAGEGRLTFSKANPRFADRILIDAGAAELKIDHLGNANFKKLSFDGGVGSFEIDFSGNYETKSRAKVSIGMGEAVIFVPADLPFRIEADEGFLSNLEFKNAGDFDIDDGYCESDNFSRSDYGLSLEVDIGLGSIEIIFVD